MVPKAFFAIFAVMIVGAIALSVLFSASINSTAELAHETADAQAITIKRIEQGFLGIAPYTEASCGEVELELITDGGYAALVIDYSGVIATPATVEAACNG